jgi:hypothetical protein
MTTNCNNPAIGADPVIHKWTVVRGDTSNILVEFLEADEKTFIDTTGWTYVSSAYDPKLDTVDELTVVAHPGYVEVVAPADVTKLWGTGHNMVVAELSYDLQVTKADGTIWTPVIGNIVVIGDVTYGGSL